MNDLKKKRIKTILKYTWPFYIISAVLIGFGLHFIFGITHKTPVYQTLTVFISGEDKDDKQLKKDLLESYKDNELKMVSSIYASVGEANYYRKLSVLGYNSADVMIIPTSILENLNASAFALDITDGLYQSYFKDFTTYKQNDVIYGIEIDKEKTNKYFTLPSETCYMVLGGASKNTGTYSSDGIKEHDNALRLVKDWGK